MRTFAVLCVLSLFACAYAATLTGQQKYDAILASLTALEAHGTSTDQVKISLIVQTTNFASLQALYGAPSARRFLKKK